MDGLFWCFLCRVLGFRGFEGLGVLRLGLGLSMFGRLGFTLTPVLQCAKLCVSWTLSECCAVALSRLSSSLPLRNLIQATIMGYTYSVNNRDSLLS